MENIREIVRQLIVERIVLGGLPVGFLDDTDLQGDGILDSLSTLNLVSCLEERFGISFMPEELGGDDFSSVARIELLVKNKITGPS